MKDVNQKARSGLHKKFTLADSAGPTNRSGISALTNRSMGDGSLNLEAGLEATNQPAQATQTPGQEKLAGAVQNPNSNGVPPTPPKNFAYEAFMNHSFGTSGARAMRIGAKKPGGLYEQGPFKGMTKVEANARGPEMFKSLSAKEKQKYKDMANMTGLRSEEEKKDWQDYQNALAGVGQNPVNQPSQTNQPAEQKTEGFQPTPMKPRKAESKAAAPAYTAKIDSQGPLLPLAKPGKQAAPSPAKEVAGASKGETKSPAPGGYSNEWPEVPDLGKIGLSGFNVPKPQVASASRKKTKNGKRFARV